MSIKESLKQNNVLRRIVKKCKIYIEYLGDAKDYSGNYLEAAEKKGNSRYKILLLVHSLEKGMCMPEPRPFGKQKVKDLMKLLDNADRNNMEFEYDLGISILSAWVDLYDEYAWEKDETVLETESFISDKKVVYKAGKKEYAFPREILDRGDFSEVMLSRHSVRDFQDRELAADDIDYALGMFLEAPTACNRQMCKLYYIKNSDVISLLNSTILGVSGFNKSTMHYFIVTYDMAAFDFYGERNQGYLNAGLAAMNFVNGLHARGIGSCFMQWANKRAEDIKVKNALGLSKSEKIAIVIGAGYYTDISHIPCSCRRNVKDVFSIVE